jgi:hypothetical protein
MSAEPMPEPTTPAETDVSDVAAETEAVDAAATTEVAAAPEVAPDAPAVDATAPAQSGSSRPSVVVAALRRLVAFVLTVALFVGGIALGVQVFQVTHPPRVAVAGGDVPGAGEAPPVAKEFITALGANDADGLRSSLDLQPHADLTSEFKRFDIQKVTAVETLGTSVDGTRSATEILMRSVKTDGLPFDVNLVILVNNGKIEGFR